MELQDILAQERRARMAAERLLAQKQAELSDANRVLSKHALSLSDEILETKEVVAEIKGENTQVRADLVRANEEVVIAKRRLWDSLETIEDGFAVFDSNSRMIAANTAYLEPFDGLKCVAPGIQYVEILNIATEEGIIDIGEMRPLAWRDMMLERWRTATPKPHTLRLWDGTYIKLVDKHSRDGDTVSLGLNITESMTYQEELKDARFKAEAASRAKSAFLANMSHEIRTPMNGVVSMAELMAEGDLSDEQRLYVDTIKQSGEALLTIINDVLDYSKIEAAKVTLHTAPFDLEGTVQDVLNLLQPSATEKDIQLTLDFDMFMPSVFVGDEVRIRQVLTNLIGNAVKFTSEGHVLVRVVGLPISDAGTMCLHVTVEDSGIGIPDEMQAHIFGEFNQVEDERNRKYEGTGLGLAITRELVELMDGEIWLESQMNVGSSFGFKITLPVRTEPKFPELPRDPGAVLVRMPMGLNRNILEKRLCALGFDVLIGGDELDLTDVPENLRAVFVDKAHSNPEVEMRLSKIAQERSLPVFALCSPQASTTIDLAGRSEDVHRLQFPILRSALYDAIGRMDLEGRKNVTPEAPVDIAPINAFPETRKMRVLAAEDNKTNQLVLTKLTKALDFELTFANNGREAISLFQSVHPDLIFMDISMPEVDGKEATRTIRKIEEEQGLPRTRIVALTAHAMAGDAEEIISHGLDKHLTKPLRKDAIFAEIEQTCPEGVMTPFPES